MSVDPCEVNSWLCEGRCWICGEIADSAEHFVKASDLRFNWGSGSFAMTPANQAPIKIQGPNSTKVKYRPSLCQSCNNARTQPADRAWDEFNERIQSVAMRKIDGGLAYLPKLFSNSRWRSVMLEMHLYWAKALGCYLAECNERTRAHALREAILSRSPCPNLQLVFFAVPIGGERLLQKSVLNMWESKNAVFFMYTLNSICVAPILSPKPKPFYPQFQHWHPDSAAKFIRLHKLGDKNWQEAAERNAARREEDAAGGGTWRNSSDG